MYPVTLISEIAALRLRQRRLIKLLNDKKLIQWDGAIQEGDPELDELFKLIIDKWSAELKEHIDQGDSLK